MPKVTQPKMILFAADRRAIDKTIEVLELAVTMDGSVVHALEHLQAFRSHIDPKTGAYEFYPEKPF